MKIPCSNCNQRLEIPEELAGQTIECPACNASLAVPSLAAPPSVTPQVEVATPQVASTKKSKLPIPKWAIAAVASIVVVVAVLVGLGESVPELTRRGSEFHNAANQGNIKAVKHYLAEGVNVNLEEFRTGRTPLDYAEGEIADLLRKHGGKTKKELEVEASDISIHYAAIKGNIEAVKQHIASGTDVNEKYTDWGNSAPLHSAAYGGHKEIAELLITNGANVNAKNDKGGTPLHEAAWEGHKEIAELLIAAGADMNVLPQSGATALDKAIGQNHTELADLLRKNGAKTEEELKGAVKPSIPVPIIGSNPSVWAEAVKQAIADGADVNSQKDEAYGSESAPLHYAAEFGLTEIVELLIANGANVNAQEKRGLTPLDFAKGKTAALLRKHGGKTRKQLKAAGK